MAISYVFVFADNVNREVFALLGDQDPQMVPAAEPEKEEVEKKKSFSKKKVDKWIWHEFTNPARQDSFKLSHWMKSKEKSEVYPFARFNRKASVVSYSSEEYSKAVEPLVSDWDKIETDCLFELCERFSLRFIVIADRFSYELKEKIGVLETGRNTGTLKKRD